MYPLTLLTTNKLINLLTHNDALSQAISAATGAAGIDITPLSTQNILSSFIGPQLGDLDLQLTYPRVCVYARQVANKQHEKFRSFSGVAVVSADVWSSASLEQQTETALHFYVEGIASILRANMGDWGDGVRYSGAYDVQVHTPTVGGAGFVQAAQVSCDLEVSFN